MTGRSLLLLWCFAALPSCAAHMVSGEDPLPSGYVNPLIGTAPSTARSALLHGEGTENSAQVIPAVTVPFGMTHWTPQTRAVETKCVAPYYFGDTVISGFRGTHWLSGSCTQDYGSFTMMPVAGALHCMADARCSRFLHANEVSTPSYYRVKLEGDGVEAEMTATARCGLLRFTFSPTDSAYIVFEPNSDYGEGYVRISPERSEVIAYNPVHRIYQGWGQSAGFSGYFVVQFNQPFASYGTYESSTIRRGGTEIARRKHIGGYVRFALTGGNIVEVRVGTSFTSFEEARKNLANETAGLTFDSARERLKERWDSLLGRIKVTGGTEGMKTQFYTALYHSYLVPRIYNDCDGSYPRFAGGDSICNAGAHNYYCDFSLWDTYRALHPLFNLVIPDISADMVRSLLIKAQEGGWLPTFPCWNSYTAAMIGDHAIAVIADAFEKNVVQLSDAEYAYLRKNATQLPQDRQEYLDGKGVRALDSYMRYGFVPLDDSVKESFHKGEQVSRTLEYAFDDFALSQIARKMGKLDDEQYFLARSRNYRNVYNPAVGCVCGRFANGEFTTDFEKTKRMPYITEGTPWQYTWYVPQDVGGLIALMGGREAFSRSLDAFFAAGQYWHGNEPDQQVPFLYDYSGQPWKTQAVVHHILDDEYSDTPGGLCGNDDAGQISAWYVFASLGLYPVCPSTQEYALTSPRFEKATIRLASGNSLVILADGADCGKHFIRNVELNGTPLHGWTVTHAALVRGGTLRFTMDDSPAKN